MTRTIRSGIGIAPPRPWHHRLRVSCTLGNLELDTTLADFVAPWSILFGPSGSGKSSILRALCGLLPATRGLVLRHRDAIETDLTPLPPAQRQIAYAPQHAAIFPHLSVRENIAFSASIRNQRASTLADEAIALFDLAPLAGRSPARLSGGERQRVNLARAFAVPDAQLMLLDEPFTGLDRRLRDLLLPRMQQWLADRGIPCISVTHDIEEALLLNAEVFRIEAGHILSHGQARHVLSAERTRLLDSLR